MAFSILVCIKSVPDMSSSCAVTADGRWIDAADLPRCMNPYDVYALEAALTIKDTHGQVTVDALSAGPEHVRPAIRRAMAMGADAGIHLAMATTGHPAAQTVARAIAHFAREKEYDLILTGAVSEDLMQGLTGPMLAAALGRPCATAAVEIIPDMDGRLLEVACELEGGMTERVRLALPALVTVQTGHRRPRYPSLSNTLRSRRQAIVPVISRAEASGSAGCRQTGLAAPQPLSTCEVIMGTPAEKADRLLEIFSNKGLLR